MVTSIWSKRDYLENIQNIMWENSHSIAKKEKSWKSLCAVHYGLNDKKKHWDKLNSDKYFTFVLNGMLYNSKLSSNPPKKLFIKIVPYHTLSKVVPSWLYGFWRKYFQMICIITNIDYYCEWSHLKIVKTCFQRVFSKLFEKASFFSSQSWC